MESYTFFALVFCLVSSFVVALNCPSPPNYLDDTIEPFRLLILRDQLSVVSEWGAVATRGEIHFVTSFYEGQEVGLDRNSDSFISDSLELPYVFNTQNFSSIPVGTYSAWVRSDGGKKRIQLENVPNRSCIQIHSGNSPYQIEGCILPGDNGFEFGNRKLIYEEGAWFKALAKQLTDGSWVRVAGDPIDEKDFVSVVRGVPVVWNSNNSFRKIWELYGSYMARKVEMKIASKLTGGVIEEVSPPLPPQIIDSFRKTSISAER